MKKIIGIVAGLLLSLSFTIVANAASSDGIGPWADNNSVLSLGKRYDGSNVASNRSYPNEALGVAETTGSVMDTPTNPPTWLSLGFGGSVILGFDGGVLNDTGDDLMVYEVTGGTYPDESVKVEVSHNNTDWVVLTDSAQRDESLALPKFLPCIKYVRLTDVTNRTLFVGYPDADGYDLDAVKSLHPGEACTLSSSVSVEKKASDEMVLEGSEVTYTYEVTNTGDFDLSEVTVSDDKCSPVLGPDESGDLNDDAILNPAETWVYTCKTTLNVMTTNIVNVSAVDVFEKTVNDDDTATVDVELLGCVRSQGYWKNHEFDEPAEHSDWDELLKVAPKKGDAWTILAHQYIAAYLNNLEAYMPDEVQGAYEEATDLIHNDAGYDSSNGPSKEDRGEYLEAAGVLEKYNIGQMEVPYCED